MRQYLNSLSERGFQGPTAAGTMFVGGLTVASCLQTSANILDQGPNGKTSMQEPVQNHTAALDVVLKFLRTSYSSSLQKEVSAVGHRVVHGGFHSEPQIVTAKVILGHALTEIIH